MHFLREMSQTLLPARYRPPAVAEPSPADAEAWRQRYGRALLRFEAEGIRVAPDRAAGAQRYVQLRRQWDAPVKALARYLARDWAEVAPYERPEPREK